MLIQISKSAALFAMAFLLTFECRPALADNSDGFKLAYRLFFGKESEKEDLKECRNVDSDGKNSVLGAVNAFFCVLEKGVGITAPPTAGKPVSVTKAFGDRTVHVEIVGEAGAKGQTAAGFDADGTANPGEAYDYFAKVWVCHATDSVTCAAPADFKAAVAIAYSFKADGSINKGNLLEDPEARDNGGNGAALSIIYNTGSEAQAKKVAVKFIKANGDKMRVDGSSDAGVISVQVVRAESSGTRFSEKVDTTTNTAGAAFAQNLVLSDNSTTADPAQCFVRTSSEDGDWDYKAKGGATCTVGNYTDSVSTVDAYSVNAVLGVDGSGNWSNGMTPHPSAL